jgi:hypothetical protein
MVKLPPFPIENMVKKTKDPADVLGYIQVFEDGTFTATDGIGFVSWKGESTGFENCLVNPTRMKEIRTEARKKKIDPVIDLQEDHSETVGGDLFDLLKEVEKENTIEFNDTIQFAINANLLMKMAKSLGPATEKIPGLLEFTLGLEEGKVGPILQVRSQQLMENEVPHRALLGLRSLIGDENA